MLLTLYSLPEILFLKRYGLKGLYSWGVSWGVAYVPTMQLKKLANARCLYSLYRDCVHTLSLLSIQRLCTHAVFTFYAVTVYTRCLYFLYRDCVHTLSLLSIQRLCTHAVFSFYTETMFTRCHFLYRDCVHTLSLLSMQ